MRPSERAAFLRHLERLSQGRGGVDESLRQVHRAGSSSPAWLDSASPYKAKTFIPICFLAVAAGWLARDHSQGELEGSPEVD